MALPGVIRRPDLVGALTGKASAVAKGTVTIDPTLGLQDYLLG